MKNSPLLYSREDSGSYPETVPYRGAPGGRRRVPIPDQIGRVYVPLAVIEVTSRVMRRFGTENRECYMWWGGYYTLTGDAQVTSAVCPDIPTDFGRIQFGVQQFYSLHAELRSRDQVLIAELHTHPPGAGGQNEVDAAHAAAPYSGFVSIVVPDFAFPYLWDLRQCYIYEYDSDSRWKQLDRAQVEEKITIEETLVMVSKYETARPH